MGKRLKPPDSAFGKIKELVNNERIAKREANLGRMQKREGNATNKNREKKGHKRRGHDSKLRTTWFPD